MLKIVADENIIFAKEAFCNFGEVLLKHGREITNTDLKDADVLMIRSITNVNEELLKNTKVKFVGTATIGTDHIDIDYLKKHNIKFADAKGCNSDAVAEFVVTSIFYIAAKNNIKLKGKILGVIGCGNIGSKIEKIFQNLGLKVLINDPPLEKNIKKENFVSLEEVLKADIITLHTPLNIGGEYNTFHLFNKNNINLINENSILINTSRGSVIDNELLVQLLEHKKIFTIFDVWENEPNININLLEKVDVATPHIAGYSFEGKVNGTKMIYDAAADFFSISKKWEPDNSLLTKKIIKIDSKNYDEKSIYNLISEIYQIENDISQMKKILECSENERGKYFDDLRKEYPLRDSFLLK